MRYLVTGAAGFIGSHLSEALRDQGHDVVGLDCFTDYYDVALKEENARGQEILRLDLARDPLDLEGLDGVFHLAGQPGVRSFGDAFETYLDRNLLASQRLFEAAAHAGARFTLHGTTGSFSVEGLAPQEDALKAGADPARIAGAGWGQDERAATLRLAVGAMLRDETLPLSNGTYPSYYAAIRDALRGCGESPVKATDALAVQYLLDAGRRSARERREQVLDADHLG